MIFKKKYALFLCFTFNQLCPSDSFFQQNKSHTSSQFISNNSNAMSPTKIKNSNYFETDVINKKSITSTLNNKTIDNIGTVFSDKNNASTYKKSTTLNKKESFDVTNDDEAEFEIINNKDNKMNEFIEYNCNHCGFNIVIKKKEESMLMKDENNSFCSEKCFNDYKSTGYQAKEIKNWYHNIIAKSPIKLELQIIDQKVFSRRAILKKNYYDLIKKKEIINLKEKVVLSKKLIFESEITENYMHYFSQSPEYKNLKKKQFDFYEDFEKFYEWKEDFIKKLWNLIENLADLVNDQKESSEYDKALNASIRKKLYFIKVPEKETIAKIWGFTCNTDHQKDYLITCILPTLNNKAQQKFMKK